MELANDRITVEYTEKQKNEYKNFDVERINRFVKNKNDDLKYDKDESKRNTSFLYENQLAIAKRMVNLFMNRMIVNLMVIAKFQTGKTGAIMAFIKEYINSANVFTPLENIYVITGLSDKEWRHKPKSLPQEIRVFHRNKLTDELITEIKSKQDVLVIIDEVPRENLDQTLSKTGLFETLTTCTGTTSRLWSLPRCELSEDLRQWGTA